MAIKDTNIEIKITLSKDQANWLEKVSKEIGLTKSKFIAWMLSKKSREIAEWYRIKSDPDHMKDLEELFRIAHTPWLEDE